MCTRSTTKLYSPCASVINNISPKGPCAQGKAGAPILSKIPIALYFPPSISWRILSQRMNDLTTAMRSILLEGLGKSQLLDEVGQGGLNQMGSSSIQSCAFLHARILGRRSSALRNGCLSRLDRRRTAWSTGWSERPSVASLPGGPQNLDGEEANY